MKNYVKISLAVLAGILLILSFILTPEKREPTPLCSSLNSGNALVCCLKNSIDSNICQPLSEELRKKLEVNRTLDILEHCTYMFNRDYEKCFKIFPH